MAEFRQRWDALCIPGQSPASSGGTCLPTVPDQSVPVSVQQSVCYLGSSAVVVHPIANMHAGYIEE